jgi:hypothetical protein
MRALQAKLKQINYLSNEQVRFGLAALLCDLPPEKTEGIRRMIFDAAREFETENQLSRKPHG